MTRRDKWEQRPSVVRYREWCDLAREAATGNPQKYVDLSAFGLYAFFWLPVPESYPKKKRSALAGRLVEGGRADCDNYLKSCADALFRDDRKLAIMQGVKLYCVEGEEPRTDVVLLCHPTS